MAEGRPAWRSALSGTGAGLQWRLLLGALVGGALCGAAAWPVGALVGAALAAVVGGVTGAITAIARPSAAAPAGVVTALATTATSTLAAMTTGRPLLAGLAMAVVAVLTSAALAAGPVGGVLGTLVSLSYLLATVFGTLLQITAAPVDRLLASILVGTAVALVAAALAGHWRRVRVGAPRRRDSGSAPSPWAPVVASIRSVDAHTRDGIRRAVALGLGMALFQWQPERNAMWVFLGAYIVLLPTGRDPLLTALVRVVGTLVGVVAVGALALVLPVSMLLALAVAALLGSLLYTVRNPTFSAALMAASVTLLAGAPSGSVLEWGGLRLLDTTLGCALALLAGYLLWPRGEFRAGGLTAPPVRPPGGSES